jgi:four helix bundle protein
MDNEAQSDFRASLCWQKAHQFVLAVYNYSDYFPQKEVSGLTVQFRLAAASVAMNVAEALRPSNEDKALSLKMARDSVERCRYYLILAKDLGYGDHPELAPQLEEVSRMLDELSQEISTSDL